VEEPLGRGIWLYQPIPVPDLKVKDLLGRDHAISANTVVLFWAAGAPSSRSALEELNRRRQEFGGASILAISLDSKEEVRSAAQGVAIPVALATPEVAGTYSIFSRYLFDHREDLRLPTLFLLNRAGEVVKVYRDEIPVSEVVADLPRIEATQAERLVRAAPFPGKFYSAPRARNEFQYSLDLAEQGFEAAALTAFERTAKRDPSPITLYNVGTLQLRRGHLVEARAALERTLSLERGYADASNSLGALLARSGDLPGAVKCFRSALASKPEFPDALNNLGYALLQMESETEAEELFQKALSLDPNFAEALNNLGILFGQRGELPKAETYFRDAVQKRPHYGEARNNLALVLAAEGETERAVATLKPFLDENPTFEAAYMTLAKIYLGAGDRSGARSVLQRLLRQNPSQKDARALLEQIP
jgi:Flp pilus assembly protein TadD